MLRIIYNIDELLHNQCHGPPFLNQRKRGGVEHFFEGSVYPTVEATGGFAVRNSVQRMTKTAVLWLSRTGEQKTMGFPTVGLAHEMGGLV